MSGPTSSLEFEYYIRVSVFAAEFLGSVTATNQMSGQY